ncbi:PaaI family thioesterase [Rhodococcus sp. X156]|uniref:PaaI family thioesterase n=1 Tax=Rhodococcus sp. X156 TaxID=2499145 RepID=UPI000FD6D39E|nr:PaaI family thioesterase [Rhodococcus sp. X156]
MTGFAEQLGLQPGTTEDGRAELDFTATEEHLNPAGAVHGGVLATLVDTAMGLAVRSRTGEDDSPATSQLTITYLRPAKPGELRAVGKIRTQGEHLMVCEAEVLQGEESVVHALATFALLHR